VLTPLIAKALWHCGRGIRLTGADPIAASGILTIVKAGIYLKLFRGSLVYFPSGLRLIGSILCYIINKGRSNNLTQVLDNLGIPNNPSHDIEHCKTQHIDADEITQCGIK